MVPLLPWMPCQRVCPRAERHDQLYGIWKFSKLEMETMHKNLDGEIEVKWVRQITHRHIGQHRIREIIKCKKRSHLANYTTGYLSP